MSTRSSRSSSRSSRSSNSISRSLVSTSITGSSQTSSQTSQSEYDSYDSEYDSYDSEYDSYDSYEYESQGSDSRSGTRESSGSGSVEESSDFSGSEDSFLNSEKLVGVPEDSSDGSANEELGASRGVAAAAALGSDGMNALRTRTQAILKKRESQKFQTRKDGTTPFLVRRASTEMGTHSGISTGNNTLSPRTMFNEIEKETTTTNPRRANPTEIQTEVTMAQKRWRQAVEIILEKRAQEKQSAQVSWQRVIKLATDRGFRYYYRSLPYVWFFWCTLDALMSCAFAVTPDTRSSHGIDSLSDGYQLQFYAALTQAFINSFLATFLLFRLLADPKLLSTNVINLYLVKLLVSFLYIANLSWPTPDRLGVLYVLLASAILQVILVARMIWTNHVAAELRATKGETPEVIKALLDLKKFSNSDEPLSIGMLESLTQWLRVTHKHGRQLAIVNRNATAVLSVVVAVFLGVMGFYVATLTFREGKAILPARTIQSILAESNPELIHFKNVSFSYEPPTQTSNVHMVLLSGVSSAAFALKQNILDGLGGQLFTISHSVPTLSPSVWNLILTGMRPEVSGFISTAIPVNTHRIDSVFRRVREFNETTASIGAYWVNAFAKEGLEPFEGDMTIGNDYKTDETLASDSPFFDRLRNHTMQIVLSSADPPKLLMTHFAGANARAIEFGADSNLYRTEIERQLYAVREAVNLAADGDVVIVLSDHGQLSSVGGYGGGDPSVAEVPLWVCRKNDNSAVTTTDTSPVASRDIASTLSAIAGVPVPRHNEGSFENRLIQLLTPNNEASLSQWRDLLIQKVLFNTRLVQILDGTNDHDNDLAQFFLTANLENTTESYIREVSAIDSFMREREEFYRNTIANRNVAIAVWYTLLVLSLVMFLIMVATYADPTRLIEIWKLLRAPKQFIGDPNVSVFLSQFLMSICNYMLCGCLIAAYYLALGYKTMDVSVVYNPQQLGTHYILCLAAPIGFQAILDRLFVIPYYEKQRMSIVERQYFKTVYEVLHTIRYSIAPVAFKNVHKAYLHRIYNLFWSVFWALMALCMLSQHHFVLPWFYNPIFLNNELWDFQFAKLTVSLVSLPLLVAAIARFLLWDHKILDSRSFVQYTKMRTDKEARMRRLLGRAIAETAQAAPTNTPLHGILEKTRVLTPEMFDEQQNLIAENMAERELYLKQMEEIQNQTNALEKQLESKQDELASSLKAITKAFHKQGKRTDSRTEATKGRRKATIEAEAELGGGAEAEDDEDIGSDVSLSERDLQQLEAEVEDNVQNAFKREGKLKQFFGTEIAHAMNTDGSMNNLNMDEGFGQRQTELTQKIDNLNAETAEFRRKIEGYQSHYKQIRIEREAKVQQLETSLQSVVQENEELKLRLEGMIDERTELMETQTELKKKRRELIDRANQKFLSWDAEEDELQVQLASLEIEVGEVESKKKAIFQEFKQLETAYNAKEAELTAIRKQVDDYRKMVNEMLD